MIIMAEKPKFGSEWIEYKLIKLGGFWAIAVGTIVDNMGIKKVRIAKGKVKGKVFKDDKGNIQYEIYNKKDPISQVNRINIKSVDEWNQIIKEVESRLKKLSK